MKLTLISHFWNEEYLLPWWLKYHRDIVDDAILIDHGSTDQSRAIIEDICPPWRVVQTKIPWFDAPQIDAEVNEYERECPGWKVVLNTTEYLCGDVRYAMKTADMQGIRPNGVALVDPEAMFGVEPERFMPIHKQRHWGMIEGWESENRRRLIHRYSWVPYRPGRHSWPNWHEDNPTVTIAHLAFSPMTERFIARKMQIQERIAPHIPPHMAAQCHHIVTREQLLENWRAFQARSVHLPSLRWWRDTTRTWC